jgi:16S rRNA (guanine966-N2)-methyltransferase
MRVIGGTARGRTLKGPPKPRTWGTSTHQRRELRPTSDLVRGVIFDMLDAMGASYDRVLDLYAGTGALGIEALSRGEGTTDFVENNPAAVTVIRANLASTGFTDRAAIHRVDVREAPRRVSPGFTLVLADPPYYDASALAGVQAVASAGLVAPGGVLVLEHHRRTAPPERLAEMKLYKTRRHGDTVVSIYEQEENS